MGEGASSAGTSPLVGVIIATYNYSNVLRYALQSVLWQTFQDFELWVIGDGCTDDTETVVQSFSDSRIHWHNLPENTGGQSMPNNAGISLARSKYIAYLGHDDLWYPNHLQVLVDALEASGADAAHTLTMTLQRQQPYRQLMGVFTDGQYHPFDPLPPSSLMHLRAMVADTGGWSDYRTIRIAPDTEFESRAAIKGKRFISVPELTVFKFPSAARKNVYIDKPTHEQAAYTDRILHESDFLYHELVAVIHAWESIRHGIESTYGRSALREPGELVELYRANRGFEPKVSGEKLELVDDLISLMEFNRLEDITPAWCREYLQTQQQLPQNGLLLGSGWHGFEHDESGGPLRWVSTDAEILLTNLDPHPWLLSMLVRPGHANEDQPVTVALTNPQGETVDKVRVHQRARVTFHIPVSTQKTMIYRLKVLDSANKLLPTDPRILNFGVSDLQLDTLADTF